VEHHGQNPRQNVIAVIPARYSSVRLPGKLLLPVAGKPLILYALERASQASTISRVIVATDDDRIFNAVTDAGGEAVVTSPTYASGTDRVAEIARSLPENTIIVNVQGDEPVISPETIDRAVAALLEADEADMSTTWEPIDGLWELLDGNNVKVVVGDDGFALHFSRSPMPWPREASLRHGGDPNKAIENEPELLQNYKKHTGVYVYRRDFLLKFTQLGQTWLERYEMLEQLRALENGARIKVVEAAGRSIGVDTQDDYERVRDIIEAGIDIRPVKRSDLPRVAAVHVESWQKSFAGIAANDFLNSMSIEKRLKAYSERQCGGDYLMFVAEHPTDGIVGFADFGTPTLAGDFDAQIFSFYFLPEYQRRGLGSRLFRRAVSRISRTGKRSLCLDALEASPYRTFYEKMGGNVVARDGHKLGDKDFATVIYGWHDVTKI
jgi:3-deoxy-manno-octulosonate cytidylyltransferase (CMP-KDO synthetase)